MEIVHQDNVKMNIQTRVMKPIFKKVQVVYCLSRNGLLEHPHYMEVTHLAHQQLRLKDVMDRLTVLRGKGMPSLYSWSCKRSYKNGYVWNDLAQNDVIFPSEGAEYVLKGSELVLGCTDKLHQLQLGENQPKARFSARKLQIENPDEENEEEYEVKTMHTKCSRGVSTEEEYEAKTMHPRCSRGVSTEEEYEVKTMQTRCSRGVSTEDENKQKDTEKNNNNNITPTELNLDTTSPPSTTSSTLSDNPNNEYNNMSKRFEDGDPVETEPMLSRNSMLFSLIACGGSGSFRKSPPPLPPCTAGRKSGSGSSLHKGVVCRAAAAAKMELEEDDMISYMSENPRFGNLQSEEKEYFSGSIVESIVNEERIGAENGLKKSSSYNQERSRKCGLGEVAEEEEVKQEKGMMGKCMPRKKKSSSKQLIKN